MAIEQILQYYNTHLSAAKQGIQVNWEAVSAGMATALVAIPKPEDNVWAEDSQP